MKKIIGNLCTPKGFLSSGIYAGLKKNPEKKDLAIIYSQRPAAAAGIFTTNKLQAAPVLLTKKHLQSGQMQAIVINSGNANACTGQQGYQDAVEMATITAKSLHIAVDQVGVASTGVIGVPLPIQKINAAIPKAISALTSDPEDNSAAHAILTTDTFTKTVAVEYESDGKKIRLAGIAKGSGMIHPMMATMLAFITTDAAISSSTLQEALMLVNADSFHMISVDGDTSTNDMVLAMANGMAENLLIDNLQSESGKLFLTALNSVCIYLAKMIAQDGEGASKLIEINLSGASTKDHARIAARAICKSSLVKTAIFGEDANWGRIAAAVGASGVQFDPDQLCIHLGDLPLFINGLPLIFDELAAKTILQQKNISVRVHLGNGCEQATAWGCDLTYDYIKINASYRS